MRKAEIDDLRRSLERRHPNAAPSFEKIEIRNLPGFSAINLQPKTGFLAICGGTGIGKSALMEMIYIGLSRSENKFHSLKNTRLGTATVAISVAFQSQQFQSNLQAGQSAAPDEAAFPNGVRILGMPERTSYTQSFFMDSDLSVLKEGVDSYEFDKTMLEAVSFVCRKAYDEIKVYEVETESDFVVPLFEIKESGHVYDSRSMATGELSVLHIAWTLRSLESYSIVLIEEPEAFLPPVAHEGIFALIAKYSIAKKVGVIVTTHSRTIAGELPASALISLKRSGGVTNILATPESRTNILSRLGLLKTVTAVLFVEDNLARDVLKEILGSHRFQDVSYTEVIVCKGGAGNIRTALKGIPDDISVCRFIGVFGWRHER